jgi:aminopeptidase N
VKDFVAGGMENTSTTTLTDFTLFTDATENIRDSEGLVAHELAHQWFGDLVTCRNWSDTWLNEGFATFYETLYTEHKHGRDHLLYELYQRARMITSITNTDAIVRRTYTRNDDMFSHLSYQKGSWVLHMLRSQLGPELYRRCIQTYLQRHAHQNVTTENLRAVIAELSGRYYEQFFDQWVYHGGQPELDLSYSWDELAKLATVTVRQAQKTGDNVLLFNFPLKVRFRGAFGTTNRTVQVSQKEEDFTFKLDSAPSLVRFDPDYALLAKINFTVPSAMLAEQLADKDDLIGRLLALDQIKDNKSRETIARLKHALNNDPFYGVRIQAATILRTLHTDEAFETLLASREQSDARVRREVVNALAGFYRNETYEAMRKVLDSEKNPDILVIAIRALGAYPQPEVKDLLLKYLDSDSYRNELAVGALEAMRAQDDPVYVATLLERLPKREPDFTSRGYAQGLGALAFLARNEENKAAVRDFLLGYLNSKKRSVQYASITGLGTLGDPKAVAALETFTTAAKDSRERTAAAQAIADLRAARKPVDEFRGLRTEVMDLQKTTRELRKELDALKKKSEANSAGGTAKPAAKKTKSKPVAASPRSQ